LPRILLLDVETKPNLAYVWGLHNEFIPLDRLIRPGGIMCWAAKFYKEKEMHFRAEWDDLEGNFIQDLHGLMAKADAIITYNGNKFDLPKIKGEGILLGLPPLPPTPSIDLYTTCRRLGYPSGKLAFVARHLGLGAKGQHAGFDTWVGAMEGIESDQMVMERYNKQDVRLLERLYRVLLPHIKNHPYLGTGERPECPHCGSTNIQKRGVRRTRTAFVEKIHCQACGAWSSGASRKIGAVVAKKKTKPRA
jgi:hypothetical protein